MKEKVGVGIIGTGFARRVQIPCFLECADVEIVSVSSGRVENAEATAKEFGIKHWTGDWRETAAHEAVDLVCITTPPNLHLEMTLFAIERGKHVLCEKPMAMNRREAGEMLEKAREKGVLALIDHELRFQNGRQKAFEMLHRGDIGRIRHAKYSFRAPHRGDSSLPWNWWSDVSQGGGALGAIGSHVIDSFLWFLGDVSQISCQLQTHIKQRRDADSGELRAVTTDDEANMLLRFADSALTEDATGIVSISMTEAPKYENRIEFFGTGGALRIEHRGEIFLARTGDADWREIDCELGKAVKGVADTGFSRGFMSFAPEIVKAIREGRTEIQHAATFADGLKVQLVLDKAVESSKNGRAVEI